MVANASRGSSDETFAASRRNSKKKPRLNADKKLFNSHLNAIGNQNAFECVRRMLPTALRCIYLAQNRVWTRLIPLFSDASKRKKCFIWAASRRVYFAFHVYMGVAKERMSNTFIICVTETVFLWFINGCFGQKNCFSCYRCYHSFTAKIPSPDLTKLAKIVDKALK